MICFNLKLYKLDSRLIIKSQKSEPAVKSYAQRNNFWQPC